MSRFNNANTQKSKLHIPKIEELVHQYVNQERTKRGLPKLSYNRKLACVARTHSQDMAERSFFAHETPEGKTPSIRGEKRGFFQGVGENIATRSSCDYRKRFLVFLGSADIYWLNNDELALWAVKAWMNSRGHRRNILTPDYQTEGIGVVVSQAKNSVYFTQNFIF